MLKIARTIAISGLGVAFLAMFLIFSTGLDTFAAGDELRVRARQGADIDTMDPAHYRGNEEYNIDLALYSKLVRFTPGSADVELDAAESLEISDNGRVIEFTLREGIQFHHGYGEMTAEDVKFSFERIADPDENSAYASDWGALVEVEVTGRYSGRIIMEEPFAPLFSSTLPFGPGSIISKAAYEDRGGRFATQPVGSGPYYWAEWDPNQRIVLQRFDDYYGEQPDFERIVIRPIEDTRIAEIAFDSGELDVTSISLDAIDRYRAAGDTGVHTLSVLRYHWLGFNQEFEPFDDVRVREAVRYAVNVDEVLAGAYAGVAARANSMIAPGILGHWEDAPEYQQDLDRARELLAEAGYPDGLDTVIATDSGTEHSLAATIIQRQLERVGIRANINIVPHGFTHFGEESHPGMHYQSFSATLDPGYWMEWFRCGQAWNYWKWCNEEYDSLRDLGAVTVDPDERSDIYVRMQQLIDEDVTAVWITNGADVQVSQPHVDPVYLGMYAQYHFFGKSD